jgi:raffinose/stachyose/melibiose transport system substrate-binding protein
MNKSLRWVVVLILSISMIAAFSFAGCKTTTTTEATTAAETTAAETTAAETTAAETTAALAPANITFMNSKSEIQTQLEEAAKLFSDEHPGVTVEMITAPEGSSPFERITALYASGNAPALAMLDAGQIELLSEKILDLSGEKWVADCSAQNLYFGTMSDGRILAFPFTVEGYAFIYNKAVLDKAYGGSFDPTSIKTLDDLKSAFEKVKASGVTPLVISPMDWSLGAHFLTIAYTVQAADYSGVLKFLENLKSGSVDLMGNAGFNGLMDTFDLMKEYNLDKADPLSGTYEKGPEVLGKGEVGFWFMGNWAWPQIASFDTANGAYGFIPVPISNNAGDRGNSQITVSPTKYITVDKEQNSPAQQAAALAFLNWLVYSPSGQDALVNKCGCIPAFSNFTIAPADPLAKSIVSYMSEGNTLPMALSVPTDHWSVLGASMQKYLGGQSDRKGLFGEIEKYWKNVTQ